MLEENVSVLVGTAHGGMLGVESVLSECLNGVHVAHLLEIFIIPKLYFLNLMRGSEAVEEVDERNSALDSRKVSDGTEIHNLLRVSLGKHGKTGLTACVNIRVIAEDVERVRSYAACGNVEYAGKQLACNLIHIGNHKKKSLRCGVGRGKSTGRKRTVYRTRSSCLGLHFGNLYGCTEDVLLTLCCPLVNIVCHRAGRCDGVNTRNLGKRVRHVCGGVVTVHGLHFSGHLFFPPW